MRFALTLPLLFCCACGARPLDVRFQPRQVRANGYDIVTLTIAGAGDSQPTMTLADPHSAVIERVGKAGGQWEARIRSGVIPGRMRVQVESVQVEIPLLSDDADSAGDGTPDFLRLDTEKDRRAFRRWFAYLAEVQYFRDPATRPIEIADCAALIRYAYHEALHAHDSAWANDAKLPMIPAFDSVAKYQYPFTPLGAALFRVREGPYRPNDDAFLQFADARTLWRFNTHPVSRDLSRAEPGDLLFFRKDDARVPFHSMIYLGPSQVHPDGARYVLYHTGPDGNDKGELKRMTVEELQAFPQPEWRPIGANRNFLGVARWNILRKEEDGLATRR